MGKRSLTSQIVALALLLAALLGIAVASLGFGAESIGWGDVLRILAGEHSGVDPVAVQIVRDLRMPRVCLAILVGAALAAAGMAMQALFQNPLADPYIVGVAPGASVGATMATALGVGSTLFGAHAVSIAAFVGSLIVSILVYLLASRFGRVPVLHLLLFGVALGALCTGITSLILMITPTEIHEVYFWLLGSFQGARWSEIGVIAPYLALGVAALFYFAREMDVILLGEDEAQSLGIEVERMKRLLLVAATLLAAIAVAVSGIIAFVGLIVPHMMRLVVGPRHRVLLPASLLCGGALMVVSDTLARSALSSIEMPVGIVTTFLGVPFFIFLLSRRRQYVW